MESFWFNVVSLWLSHEIIQPGARRGVMDVTKTSGAFLKMLLGYLIIDRLWETSEWPRWRMCEGNPISSRGFAVRQILKCRQCDPLPFWLLWKPKSSGVILWNRRQHTYLVLIHFACAELWMSNNYAHRALTREGRETFEWGSISVARAEKCILNSKHRAIMCLMN